MSSEDMHVGTAAPRCQTDTDAQGHPPRYKATEVGVIPTDWNVKSLGEVGSLTKGKGIRRDDVTDDGIACIRYGEIYTRYHNSVHSPSSRIPEAVARASQRLRTGDLLFAGSGETAEEIGKCVAYLGEAEAYAGGDIVILRPVDQNSLYLGHLLNQSIVAEQKARYGQGDAVVHISAQNLAMVKLPLPPTRNEQDAIAESLSDVDGLLGALEVLIVKKRAIKQGAMQQLLTGKLRLPGFSGEWEMNRLSSVLSVCHGKSQRDVEMSNGPYPILATGGQIGTASRPLYDQPSVLIGRKGTIDQPQYMDRPFWTVDTLFYCAMAEGNIAKFFFYRFFLINWKQYNEASGVPSLNARTIEHIEVTCPNPKEQDAIAAVLSDMDAEIAALEARRDKTCAIKRGMMQQLLTGRVRLVKPRPTTAPL